MNIKKSHLMILLFHIAIGPIVAQDGNRIIDSIRISMITPFDSGVKWNCTCVIHNELISVNIRESYQRLEIPKRNIVIPPIVVHRYFELNEENNSLFGGTIPLHSTLSLLAFDILEHRDEIWKNLNEEIESDTTWVVSCFKDGIMIDSFSIGNFNRSDNSIQLTQLSIIMDHLVTIGRFSINKDVIEQDAVFHSDEQKSTRSMKQ